MVSNTEVIRFARVNLESRKEWLGNNRSRIDRRLRRLSLQARWFISLEMRVIPAKKEALQALSVSKNVAWNALTFRFEEIDKSINSTRDTPINQRIRPCQLGVAFCDRPKSSKLLRGYFCLSEERRCWKSAQLPKYAAAQVRLIRVERLSNVEHLGTSPSRPRERRPNANTVRHKLRKESQAP